MSAEIIELKPRRDAFDPALLAQTALDLSDEVALLSRWVQEGRFDHEHALAVADTFARFDTLLVEVERSVRHPDDVAVFSAFVMQLEIGPRTMLLGAVCKHYRRARDRKKQRALVSRLDAAMLNLSSPMRAARVVSFPRPN